MRIAAVVLLVLLGVLVFQHRSKAAEESRLASIASEIAGRQVSIHCQGAIGEAVDVTTEAGWVDFDAQGRPADVAQLKRKVCHRLQAFPEARRGERFRCLDTPRRCDASVVNYAFALSVLAHESWHLRGETNEAATECYAQQTIAFVAMRLGSDAVQARGLARLEHLVVYPRMPDDYRTDECRDGGRFDLRPDSAAWPS